MASLSSEPDLPPAALDIDTTILDIDADGNVTGKKLPPPRPRAPVLTERPPAPPTDAMVGVHCVITVAAISLDLLRPAADTDAAGSELAPAFSLQISDLRADIDMLALMKADVKLRSFDIVDARAVSRDAK